VKLQTGFKSSPPEITSSFKKFFLKMEEKKFPLSLKPGK
jgi:hypothetical protein